MRKLVLAAAAIAMAACGSSNTNTTSGVSGTVGGSSFSAAETVAMFVSPTTCGLPAVGEKPLTAVGIVFSTVSGMCSTLSGLSAASCTFPKNDRSVMVILARFPTVGTATPSIDPGDYVLTNSLSIPSDLNTTTGVATIGYAQSFTTDASCTSTTKKASASAASKIHLAEVSASKVSGTADITLEDGSHIQGDFTATMCGSLPNVCDLATATSGVCTTLTCS